MKKEATLDIDKALILGDVHADINFLNVANETAKKHGCDAIIQVGDFGYWPTAIPSFIQPQDIPVYFVDGNHEEHPAFDQSIPVNNLYDGVYHVSRGTLCKIGTKQCLFIGGAYSIDSEFRTEGFDYFKEETITTTDIYQCFQHDDVDIIFSHDCPFKLNVPSTYFIRAIPNREKLQSIYDRFEPEYWFFGHYHTDYKHSNGKTTFLCADANLSRHISAYIYDFKNGHLLKDDLYIDYIKPRRSM